MTLERRIASAFRMTDGTWARHASPWSVWTRATALPLLALAVWSRAWIGSRAWAPVGLALLWTWLNPRLFPPPRSLESWASKAVLGERFWLARDARPVPARHRRVPHLLSAVAGLGALAVAWGLWRLEPAPVVGGTAVVLLGKFWFLDRMVWLREDMASTGSAQGAAGPDASDGSDS